ncbi:MAG: hypothetical protein ACUVXF_10070 [Desulfobaccales bacterium]
MLRWVIFLSALILLISTPLTGRAFESGDAADPMNQYQTEFKRKNLGAALGIDQNRVERLLQIEQKYRDQKRRAIQEAKSALQQLQQAVTQPQPSNKEVAAILDTMMRLRKEKLTLEQSQLQEEQSILTPVQQARYILFLMNLRQQVAKETQKMRSAPRGTPLPAKPIPHEVPVSRPPRGY